MTSAKGIESYRTLLGLCRRLPLLDADDRQAHFTSLINVRVIDLRQECDGRWFERILGRELELHTIRALVVRFALLWAVLSAIKS